jgi:hypothetical protein
MAKHMLLALTNPVEGSEDEYNDWYDNRHLADVLQIPGFVAAQRFRLSPAQKMEAPPWKYLAIYEIETDNLSEVIATLSARSGTVLMPISDAMNPLREAPFYEPITARITLPTTGA